MVENGSAAARPAARLQVPAVVRQVARKLVGPLRRNREAVSTLLWQWRETRRYLRWQHSPHRTRSRGQLRAAIIKGYHSFEKGMSLKEPRPAFGQPSLRYLMTMVDEYLARFGKDAFIEDPIRVIRSYAAFNTRLQAEVPGLMEKLAAWERGGAEVVEGPGGTTLVTRESIQQPAAVDFLSFVQARHSIRNFTDEPVDVDLVRRAVRMAQESPSACNRQPGRVYSFFGRGPAQEALAFQPGNRGFGHLAGCTLAVAADVQSYVGPGERHQAFIDGGLFAMSLVYALHSLGLGTCMLAWCVDPAKDAEFRRFAGVPDNEEIIMFIAVGTLPETLHVADSPRLALDDVLHVCRTADTPAEPAAGVAAQ